MSSISLNCPSGGNVVVHGSGAGSGSGAFWHDRIPRPEHRVPGTRESESERRLLWEECERLSTLAAVRPAMATTTT